MPNAHALAVLSVEPEPSTPIRTEADAPAPSEIEQLVGEVAAAAATICRSMREYVDGGSMTPTTKSQAGDLFVQLHRLQQATLGELDFPATVRREGERLLRQRYGSDFRHCNGANLRPQGLDVLLDTLLDILNRITMLERAWAGH